MPLLIITEEEKIAAMARAQSDLKWLLADNEVPEQVQAVIFHLGFHKLKIFLGLGESRTEVKDTLKVSFGLDATTDLPTRQVVSLVLAAWDSAKEFAARETAVRVEAQTSRMPRPLGAVEHLAMRQAYETKHARLSDSEVPSKAFLGRKTEDIEANELRVECLQEVSSKDDKEEELLTTEVDGMGNIKVRKGARDGRLPANSEELRAKHKLIGNAWLFLSFKHTNRSWFHQLSPAVFSDFSDYLLGKHCASLVIKGEGGLTFSPPWQLILDYEFQVRKKAYERVTNEAVSLKEALEWACSDSETRNLYLVTPLTLSSRAHSSAPSLSNNFLGALETYMTGNKGHSKGKGGKGRGSQTQLALLAPQLALPTSQPTWQAKGNRTGKGNKGNYRVRPYQKGKGKDGGNNLKYHKVTPDGRSICYKFNNLNEHCNGMCGMVHVCQLCFDPSHGADSQFCPISMALAAQRPQLMLQQPQQQQQHQ